MLSPLRNTWALVAIILGGLVLLFGVGLLLYKPPPPPPRTAAPDRPNEETLEQARDILAKANDYRACRTGLQELNVRLGHDTESRPEPLPEDQARLLTDAGQLGLSPEELAEVDSPNFTLLDAHFLELCFQLDDAVRVLDVDGLSQPEQAGAAFGWVMRQLRPVDRDEPLLAPEFVLHRGWGTTSQRALAFVSLLGQLGIPGCVLTADDTDSGAPRVWACGALVSLPGGAKQVLLFDPRLGLPLPGGKATTPELARAFRLALPVPTSAEHEPLTLAALRARPDLLKAVTVDEKHPYDVTPAQVGRSRVRVAVLLSALAPRMRYLQEQLQQMQSTRSSARLACDPAATLAAWRAAVGSGEGAPRVSFWADGARSQYLFWPPEEGGGDKGRTFGRKLAEMIPLNELPRQVYQLEGAPLKRMQALFTQSFLTVSLEPGQPADDLLHGRFEDAAHTLVQTRDQLREQKARLAAAANVDEKVRAWASRVMAAQAKVNLADTGGKDAGNRAALDAARAQFEQVWRDGGDDLAILVEGRAAEVQLPDVTYLLALCKHEQAEQQQRALDRARAAGKPVADADVQAAREAWTVARSWWEQSAGDAASPGGTSGTAPAPHRGSPAAARLLHARACLALGEPDEARRLLEDLSGVPGGPEQTARLYLAAQLKKP